MECRGEISIAVVTSALSPLTSGDALFLSPSPFYGIVEETVSAYAIVSRENTVPVEISSDRVAGTVRLGPGISAESRSIIVLPIDLSLFNFYTSARLTVLRDSKSISVSI